MKHEEVLDQVLHQLDAYHIQYMIVGSFASSLYGIPRTTNDADIVILAESTPLRRFVDTLQKTFYADEQMALDALEQRLMFNIIHLESGFKIDLIVPKDQAFGKQEFQRRRLAKFFGTQRWFASPEDTILRKLEWSNLGGSERQFTDALTVARVQSSTLDREYLVWGARELQVERLLEKLFGQLSHPGS